MTTTIYKYHLTAPITDLYLPLGAVVRHVATDQDFPTLWIEHPFPGDPAKDEKRTFVGFGTGHPIMGDLEFVGTVTGVEGWVVIHVFERLS